MSGIIRAPRPVRGWTEIQNDTLRDGRLSYRARGVLARLLSNADGWHMTAHELAAESPGEGRQAILTALRELRESGYIVQRRLQGEKGRWRTETYVYDTPQESAEVRLPDSGSTGVRSPDVGGPDVGQPDPIRKTSKKKQEKNQQNPLKRERGEAPPEGGKPPLSQARGRNAVVVEDQHGICLQAGNERDADAMRQIERHGSAETAAAVAVARNRDPQGRAWPTAVLRLLLQARSTTKSTGTQIAPAWARLYPAPVAAPAQAERIIDIADMENDT
ncbi:MAG: hypothetical protein ACYCWA_00270 [Thiobacillus sp.]